MHWPTWLRRFAGKSQREPVSQKPRTNVFRLHAEELERRIFMSASPFGLFVPDVELPATYDGSEASSDLFSYDSQYGSAASDATDASVGSIATYETPAPEPAGDTLAIRREVVLVDKGLANYQQLLDDILSQSDPWRQIDVAYIDEHLDGLIQVTAQLADYELGTIDALHILSHGTSQAWKLGSTWLDSSNLATRELDFLLWGSVLHADADLLLYGSELASDQAGRDLLSQIADWTGADVAADSGPVGPVSLGGNQNLDHLNDPIETQVETLIASKTREVVFVQGDILDLDLLVIDVQQQADIDGRAIAVYILSGSDSGFDQVSEVLADYAGLDAIHFVSHGADGMIQLGGSWLTADNVDQHADVLANWGMALSENGDILIYGCDVAETSNGQQLLHVLSTHTGADIAASTDLTGSAILGGNWELEYAVGAIEAPIAFTVDMQAGYTSILATINGTAGNDLLAGTASDDTITGLAGDDVLLGGVNAVADGQFLNAPHPGHFVTYSSGQTMGGWSVTQGSVDLLGTFGYTTPTGGRGVDMDGSSPGTISQNLSTTVGNTYIVRFITSVNAGSTRSVEVSAAGASSNHSHSNSSTWGEHFFTFTANSTTTTLQFRSLSPSGSLGIVLGDVSVHDTTTFNGDDVLIGGGGNDIIDGGAGNDTVVFTGNLNDYTITSGSDTGGDFFTIQDNTPDRDGTDRVYRVENFQFADGTRTAANLMNLAPAFGVPGSTGFSGDGIATNDIASDNDVGNSVVVLPDGKVLVAGSAMVAGNSDFLLMRYNADGSLDTTFGGGDGIVTTNIAGGNDYANSIKVLASGKILVAGYGMVAGSNDFVLVRYNADGSLDTTFGGGDGIVTVAVGSGTSDIINEIAVQSDGKIVVVGTAVARFNADGTLDTSFGGGDGFADSMPMNGANSVAIQSDGKIVVGGHSISGWPDSTILRYNTDGTLDTTFSGDGIATNSFAAHEDWIESLVIQPDGKIVAVGTGWFGQWGTIVSRWNTDGSLDTTFGSNGVATFSPTVWHDPAHSVALQADGKVVIAGYGQPGGPSDFLVLRLNVNGTLDNSFGGGSGFVLRSTSAGDDIATDVVIQADGKIVVTGYGTNGSNNDITVVRFNADGSLDADVAPSGLLGGTVNFTEGSAAVVLDGDVTIADPELSAADNFAGATLTLSRQGSASAEDVFSGGGTLSFSGSDVIVSGTTIGTLTNTGGTLAITFNANATNALVNSAMQQIRYSNSSDNPPASAVINWTFSDGNTGAQGGGGALSTTGSVTVDITAINDPPVAVADTFTTANNTPVTFDVRVNDLDPDSDPLTVTHINGNAISLGNPVAIVGGSVALGADGTLTLTPNAGFGGRTQFTYTISDGVASSSAEVSGFVGLGIDAARSTDGGLALNMGTLLGDSYLQADNGGAIFGGRTALTVELQAVFEPLSNGSDTLIEYQLAGGTDEFRLTRVDLNNALRLMINGTEVTTTDFDFSTLEDGQPHSLAVSWNSSGGDWSVYVDGILVASGTGLQSGHTLQSGGALIIGQQQNSSGGFDTHRGWQATLQDVRIFSDVRTASEIAASYRSDLPFNEPGMIANWRFNDLSSAGVTTDSVAGNNLTLANTGEASHVAGTASLVFAVNENALNGTVVGQVYGVDAEREARIAALLAADANLLHSAETGKFYKLVQTDVTWSSANTAALATNLAGVSGQLGTIRSAAEQSLFTSFYATINDQIWLGGRDSTVEGVWRWQAGGVDGDLFWTGNGSGTTGFGLNDAYTNWTHSGEPNNAGNEDNLIVWDANGRWNDWTDAGTASYVVEWNADDVLDATNALTYSIQSQTVAGAFAIDASTGWIIVADGSLLDYETGATHTLTIRVNDGTNTYDKAFSVSLNDLAEGNDNAPTNLSSGIELNTDGGNDAYLIAQDGGAILGGLTSFTFETQFATTSGANNTPLLSYEIGTYNSNIVVVDVSTSGNLRLTIGGTTVETDYAYANLADGQIHSVAATWDNSSGAWAIYVDGETVGSGTGLRVGYTIASGGSLVFGQEQDGANMGYSSNQVFSGTLYDLRLWNEVRSEPEIALNYQNKFDAGNLPSGLVANWQMDGFNGSNQVVDLVSGNNLSIGHATNLTTELTTWTNQVGGVTANGNTLTYVDEGVANGWGPSGITSTTFSSLGYTDNYTFSFTLDNTTNFASMIGLGLNETNANWDDVDHAFYFYAPSGSSIQIYESGASIGTFAVNYTAGSEFSIYVNGTTLQYQHNGTTFLTRTITAGQNFYVDTSFYRDTGTFGNQDDYSFSNLRVFSGNTEGTGFIASTSREDLHISENSPGGTSVGFVVPSDPDISNDVVKDGLFLEAANPGSHTTYSAGQTIGDWTVRFGSVDLIGTLWPASPLGGRSIDLNGSSAGGIYQTLDTVAGRQYQVVFAMSGHWGGGDAVKDVRVSADGVSQDFSIAQPVGWSTSNMLFINRSFTFTATDGSTELDFASLDTTGSFWGPAIADVRVIEIPAAVTTILNNDPTLSYDAATGKFYRVVNSATTWTAAQTAANSATLNGQSGQLATVRSSYENDILWDIARSINADVWIGASDQTVEGTWRWQDGTADGETFWLGNSAGTQQQGFYQNWKPGEPSATVASEDYARIQVTNGQWLDSSASNTFAYIIEWDASEVLSSFTFTLTDDANGRFTINANTGEITVAGGASIDYETATSHNVTVQVTDAAGNSYNEVMSIAVDNLGGEPTQTIPIATQTINEDTTLVFNTAGGNAITVSDTNAGSNTPLQVLLTVNNGTLTLAQATGLSIPGGANGSGFMVLQGTESDINAALEGLTYTPTANYNGSDSLTVTTSLGADLQGLYTFEDGNVADQSIGTANNGTFQGGATTVVDPQRGEVLSLDGVDSFVAIDPKLGFLDQVTVAAWVKVDSGSGHVVSLGNDIILEVRADGTLQGRFRYDNASVWRATDSSATIVGEGWKFVSYVFDQNSQSQRLYVDGVLVGETAHVESIVQSSSSLLQHVIGANGNPTSGFLAGLVDDARIYTRALSADEIAALATDQTSTTGTVAIQVDAVNDGPAFGVPGSVGFGGDGIVSTDIAAGDDVGNSVAVLPDGRVLVAGSAVVAGNSDFLLMRYNVDGSLDTTFGGGDGIVTTDIAGGNDSANSIQVLASGKVLVAGHAMVAGNNDFTLVQYNADGSLDTTFGGGDGIVTVDIGSGTSDSISEIAIQSDGKIVVVGSTVARFNADGSLDTSFGGGDGIVDSMPIDNGARSVAIQSDGKILVGGFTFSHFWTDSTILRYNIDGTLDTTFSGDGIATHSFSADEDWINDIVVQSDGKIVAVGAGWGGTIVSRLNTDGSLDTGFGTGGSATFNSTVGYEEAFSVALQADGRIVVAGLGQPSGSGGPLDVIVLRVNVDGTLDNSFGGGDGFVVQSTSAGDDWAIDVVIQADGKIVAAGYGTNGSNDDIIVVRFNADGTLDADVAPSGLLGGTVNFTEGSAAVVLDGDVTIADPELSAADNFAGATLTLSRQGSASAEDVFSGGGTLSFSGSDVIISGTTIGTLTNTGGTLTIAFNANATNALVNSAMQQIRYSNSSDNPPASVQLDWTFNDGNTGDQGSGGALTAIGSTTVNITAINDPLIANPNSYTALEGNTITGNLITDDTGSGVDSDPDGNPLSIASFSIAGVPGTQSVGTPVLIAGVGTITIQANGNFTFVPETDYNGSVPTITYTLTDTLNSRVPSLYVTSDLSGTGPLGTLWSSSTMSISNGTVFNFEFFASASAHHAGIANARWVLYDPSNTSNFQYIGPQVRTGGWAGTAEGIELSETSTLFTSTFAFTGPSGDYALGLVWTADSGGAGRDITFAPLLSTAQSQLDLTVQPVNDAPVIVNNTGMTVGEGTTTTITTAMLSATDIDDTDATLEFHLTSALSGGQLELTTNAGVAITSFTNQQVTDGQVVYVNFSNSDADDSFDFEVRDGGEDGVTFPSGTFNIVVDPDSITTAPDTFTMISGAPIAIDVVSNDVDAQGDLLSVVEIIDTAGGGTVTVLTNAGDTATLASGTTVELRSDGRLNVIAASDGTETFQYRVSDGGESDTETVTLNVTTDETTAQAIGFVTTWDTTLGDGENTIELLVNSGSDNYTIFWGDGTSTTGASGNTSHTYATAGQYTISIVGDLAGFAFDNTGDIDKLTSIEQWGNVAFENFSNAFDGADNLVYNATDNPDLTGVTSLAEMFRNSSFNGDISNWDVSSVTNMSAMFLGATSFNSDISGWDVSSVTNMNSMFRSASNFSADLSGWDVSSVETMREMFRDAVAFNSDLSGWDVSSVNNMFRLFRNAGSFNSDLSGWNVGSVTNMSEMFSNASSFDSDLSGWNISLVTNMSVMLNGSGMSATNYDNTLIGWAGQSVQSNVTLGAAGRVYTEVAFAARDTLVNTYGWTITGDLTVNDAPSFSGTLDGNPTYVENGPAMLLDIDVAVSDLELDVINGGNGNYSGASLTIVRDGGANSVDTFSFVDGNGITLSAGNLFKNGQAIASFDTTSVSGELTITWTDAGGEVPTKADVDVIMRQVAYANASENPAASVQLNWTFRDGNTGVQGTGGELSATGSTTVDITAVNDAPVQAAIEVTPLAYTENDGPVAITSAMTITDVDDTHIESAIVAITGNYHSSEDLLSFTNQNGITGSYNSSTGTWTLTGSATLAQYEAAIRSITYTNNSEHPDTTTRTISFTVNDGDANSNTVTRDITITRVNDAPIANADSATAVEAGGTANGTAGTNPTGNVLTNDTDVDSGDTKTVIGVSAGVPALAGGPVSSPIAGTYGSITIAADGSYTYTIDNDNPTVQALNVDQSLQDVFTYTMQDSGGLTSTAQITITIEGANDEQSNRHQHRHHRTRRFDHQRHHQRDVANNRR